MVTIIEAKEYEEARQRLAKDPIIIAMAHGLANVPREEIAHEDGTPRHEFMLAANREYRERGGEDGYALGTIPDALIRVLDSGVVKPTKVVTYHASRDSLTASGDENRAMCHASIYGGESFKEAKKALADYMVNEAGYLIQESTSEALHERAAKMLAKVADVFAAKFPELSNWEYLDFEVDQLQFRLVRSEREVSL